MSIATIPALFTLVGLVMFAFFKNAKVSQIGRTLFFVGMLVLMFSVAKQTTHIPLGPLTEYMH
jgi:Na+/phosphate symporter